jgi:hypothetical protein
MEKALISSFETSIEQWFQELDRRIQSFEASCAKIHLAQTELSGQCSTLARSLEVLSVRMSEIEKNLEAVPTTERLLQMRDTVNANSDMVNNLYAELGQIRRTCSQLHQQLRR